MKKLEWRVMHQGRTVMHEGKPTDTTEYIAEIPFHGERKIMYMIKFGVNGNYVCDCNTFNNDVTLCESIKNGQEIAQDKFNSLLEEVKRNLFE